MKYNFAASLNFFYCLFIAFPMFRLKVFNWTTNDLQKDRNTNALAYKWVVLWTGEIKVNIVKTNLNHFVLKRISHNVFNLSSGGNAIWIVNS